MPVRLTASRSRPAVDQVDGPCCAHEPESGPEHVAVRIDDVLLGLISLEVRRCRVSFNPLKSRGFRSKPVGTSLRQGRGWISLEDEDEESRPAPVDKRVRARGEERSDERSA
jgi:hypothetical protein